MIAPPDDKPARFVPGAAVIAPPDDDRGSA
jgi:hypothetical protein